MEVKRQLAKMYQDLKLKEKELGSISPKVVSVHSKIKSEISEIQKRMDKIRKENNLSHDKKK